MSGLYDLIKMVISGVISLLLDKATTHRLKALSSLVIKGSRL